MWIYSTALLVSSDHGPNKRREARDESEWVSSQNETFLKQLTATKVDNYDYNCYDCTAVSD